MSDQEAAGEPAGDVTALGLRRLLVGALQGLALYLLYRAVEDKTWPATDPYWIAPLAMVFRFVPLLFQQAAGTMRARTLIAWLVIATVLLAGLAWYDVWRRATPDPVGFGRDWAMTFALGFFAAIGLFIAQALILAADGERRWIASYAAYFDAAWKLEVQLVLSAVFVAVFWGVLWLGAILFNLINVHFVETLIEKAWFAIPATTLATAAALHVTDVRARLVAGLRTLAHVLLSWLLPLMTGIAVLFVLALPFTGLAPLWAAGSAAGGLLGAAGVLVVLINAAFQDGSPEHNRARVLRYAEFVAALVLLPLVLIAAYALWLRVDQYGWTVQRIATGAATLVALCYTFGYAAAALLSPRGGVWMRLVAPVNVATAFVVLAVLLALFTPVGDPERLAAASQAARLESGAVRPANFDFGYLYREGGRYGRDALKAMTTGHFGNETARVRTLAAEALANKAPGLATPAAPVDIAANVTVYPNTRALPRTLLDQDWSRTAGAPGCLTLRRAPCDAVFADVDGDGYEEVVLVSGSDRFWFGSILKERPDKTWGAIATIGGHCPGMRAALREGRLQVVPPVTPLRDIVLDGIRLHPAPEGSERYEPCPSSF
ncbi:MAG: DUF4153 domain-containing protein [Rhizomicrobium sp.]